MRALVTMFVVAGCASSTGHRSPPVDPDSTPDPTPTYAPAYTPVGLNVPTLAGECDSGDGNACVVLGNAFEGGDSSVQGAYRSPVGAVRYWLKGCRIGNPGGCYRAGSALLKGAGVEKDIKQAADLLRQTCDTDSYKNMMQGFGCSDAARALLALDSIANHAEAMRLLDKACTLQPPLCDVKAQYVGTGLKAQDGAPTGAVGFGFGDSPEKTRRTCLSGRGTIVTSSKGETFCHGYTTTALDEPTRFVGLGFCGQTLCSITVAIDTRDFYGKYLATRKTLIEHYRTPGSITFQWPIECKTDAQLMKCIEDKRARFLTGWQWTDGTQVLLQLASSDGNPVVLIAYDAPAATQAFSNDGL
jgi:hypothetical protein